MIFKLFSNFFKSFTRLLCNTLSHMSLDPDYKTKYFLEKIDLLISKGVIKNHAEIVQALSWNKSVMSSVKNGNLPVPQHIYNKFREVYTEYLNEKPSPGDEGYKEKYIALLEARVKDLEEARQLAQPSPEKGTESHLMKIREDLKQLFEGQQHLQSLMAAYSKRLIELQVGEKELQQEVDKIEHNALSDAGGPWQHGTGGGTGGN
jgi:vacuolar-type H+-ATPase catalytic subunit A/Vma1